MPETKKPTETDNIDEMEDAEIAFVVDGDSVPHPVNMSALERRAAEAFVVLQRRLARLNLEYTKRNLKRDK